MPVGGVLVGTPRCRYVMMHPRELRQYSQVMSGGTQLISEQTSGVPSLCTIPLAGQPTSAARQRRRWAPSLDGSTAQSSTSSHRRDSASTCTTETRYVYTVDTLSSSTSTFVGVQHLLHFRYGRTFFTRQMSEINRSRRYCC